MGKFRSVSGHTKQLLLATVTVPETSSKFFGQWNGEQIGTFFLKPGETDDFAFHDKFIPKNKINCTFRQIRGPSVMIRAFEGSSGAFDHGKKNYWDAREDGIYFTHGQEVSKLEYKWT
ncbi:unnamed protein product [Eruca vesicaria subsp. sativa]|uniref:S-protein homolog n=1 Tax=Eruca vesicaria subsp. sativa TaxID=29727 RepID=A0ABC8KLA6_ERUVS|nr:unnamed protein product [Eruca vesicaria subsp. sativa]